MKLHHVGIVTEDIESGIQRYKAMFGFVPVTEVVDDPVQKVSVVCILGTTDSAWLVFYVDVKNHLVPSRSDWSHDSPKLYLKIIT